MTPLATIPHQDGATFSHRVGDAWEITAERANGRPLVQLRHRSGARLRIPFGDAANVAAGIDRAVSFIVAEECKPR